MAGRGKVKTSKQRLKKLAVQCYFEPEQAAALRSLSDKTRVPAQVYIREGLDMVLNKYKTKV